MYLLGQMWPCTGCVLEREAETVNPQATESQAPFLLKKNSYDRDFRPGV